MLGISKLKYCRQIMTTSKLSVLNSLITKSSGNRSDFASGQPSKSYSNKGIHLLDNSCIITSSLATLPTFPKIAFAERWKLFGTVQWNLKQSWTNNENTEVTQLIYQWQRNTDEQQVGAHVALFLGPMYVQQDFLNIICHIKRY